MRLKIILFFIFFSFQSVAMEREYGLCHVYYLKPHEKDLVEFLNIQWVRNDILWQNIEPRKGEWDFTLYDQMVERIKGNGKKILGILNYDTGWIHPKGKPLKKITRENIPYFLKYVEKTVLRYRGKVDAWEIWNEPNNPFITKSKEEDFFELVKQTTNLIKKIDPKIFVVSGSLWLASDRYLEKMFQYGALEKADAISYHPYSVSTKLLPGRIEKMRTVMNKYNFKGEVWITEFGFPTHGIYPTKKLEPDSFPKEIIKSLTYFSAYGIDKIIWYTLSDVLNPGEKGDNRFNSEPYFGLSYPNGQIKEGGRSFSLFTRLVGGKKYNPSLLNFDLSKDKDIKAFAFSDNGNQNILILWRDGILSKKIRLSGNFSGLKSYNIATGESSLVSPEPLLVGKNPLIFSYETSKLSPIKIESIR